ncbi:hypothetical protein KY313_02125 [Candidatus Woesearchaeota archaeon]|jgi:hypothetical protein|nr:hypothetical protein [Candidatus Woesearchaeota archaeon]
MNKKYISINKEIFQVYDLGNGACTDRPDKESVEFVVAWNRHTKPFILDTKSKMDTYHTVSNLKIAYKVDTNCTKTIEDAIKWVSHLEENCKVRFEKGVLEGKLK